MSLLIYLALSERPSLSEAARLITGSDESALRPVIRDLQSVFRSLHATVLFASGDVLRFDERIVKVDARRFEELASLETVDSLRRAAELYDGNLLEGWGSGIAPFDAWLSERRLHYWRQALVVFGHLLAAQIKAGWWERATESASRLLSLDPSEEVVHRALIRLQLEQGRPDSALRRYQECVDVLQRDFKRQPAPETERLLDDIETELRRTPAPRQITIPEQERTVVVLVVEDDLVSAAIMDGMLTSAGYGVVIANDAAEALMELGRRRFDLLLLDINIPTINGLRLFEIMIQKGIETPAVFITAIEGAEIEARSLELGASDFLRKPLRKEVLLPRLRAILQRSERARAGLPES